MSLKLNFLKGLKASSENLQFLHNLLTVFAGIQSRTKLPLISKAGRTSESHNLGL